MSENMNSLCLPGAYLLGEQMSTNTCITAVVMNRGKHRIAMRLCKGPSCLWAVREGFLESDTVAES